MQKKPSAFPVGLYGMLLFALCWLTLPAVFAPLERVLVGGVCAVGRVWTALVGEPAVAASREARARLAEIAAELGVRVQQHAVGGVPAALARGASPVHCTVLAAKQLGGGGEFAELRLDRTYRELAGCRAVVTKGDALVGFLQVPGRGVAAKDGLEDFARVVLPNHAACRPLHGEFTTPDGTALRFVVRAAAAVDPAPLRIDLWDDPYRAARLEEGGVAVRTRQLPGDDEVPAGLLLGTTRVWGYPRVDGGTPLTLGVYVSPAVRASSLSHVVLWHETRAAAAPELLGDDPPVLVPGEVRNAVVHELPGASHGRHLLVGAGSVPDGAAVTQDGYLLGTTKGLAFGVALVTSFAAARQRWSLVLLPDAPGAAPVEFTGVVVRTDGDQVWLRGQHAPAPGTAAFAAMRSTSGHLFTGSNGAHCPAGLWIGRAVPDPASHDLWIVTVPVEHGARSVEVHLGRGGA